MITVYKTTNLVNGKYYIGVHETNDPDDSYLGSGKRLFLSIEKYGIKNFKKLVIFLFEQRDLAYAKERELLDECLHDPLCYNLVKGGFGGVGFLQKSTAHREALRISHLGKPSKLVGIPKSDEHKRKLSLANKGKLPPNTGIRMTEEAKFYLSQLNRGKVSSQKTKKLISLKVRMHIASCGTNSKDTVWITNNLVDKMIKKTSYLPEGFVYGRSQMRKRTA